MPHKFSHHPPRVVILSEAKDLPFAYAAEDASEHRDGTYDGFTAKYRTHRLVHFERCQYVLNAIAREKQRKGWLRARKVALIQEGNPTWHDLHQDFGSERKAGPSLRSG